MFKGSAAEEIGVCTLPAAATASSTPLAGAVVKMDEWNRALVIFRLGDMASETIDCIVEAVDSGGNNGVTIKSATQLAASASANDNKFIVIAVEQNDVARTGLGYIRGKITTGNVTGGLCQVIVLGVGARYGLASEYDSSSVVEIKP